MTYAEKKRMQVIAAQNDGTIDKIVLLHSRREALLKTSSIARSMLANAPSGEEADMFRKAAEEMKYAADRLGMKMVETWIRA